MKETLKGVSIVQSFPFWNRVVESQVRVVSTLVDQYQRPKTKIWMAMILLYCEGLGQ